MERELNHFWWGLEVQGEGGLGVMWVNTTAEVRGRGQQGPLRQFMLLLIIRVAILYWPCHEGLLIIHCPSLPNASCGARPLC